MSRCIRVCHANYSSVLTGKESRGSVLLGNEFSTCDWRHNETGIRIRRMPRSVPVTRAVISATGIQQAGPQTRRDPQARRAKVAVGAHARLGVSRVKEPTPSINHLSNPGFDAPLTTQACERRPWYALEATPEVSPMIRTGKGFLPNVMKTVFKTAAQCAATLSWTVCGSKASCGVVHRSKRGRPVALVTLRRVPVAGGLDDRTWCDRCGREWPASEPARRPKEAGE